MRLKVNAGGFQRKERPSGQPRKAGGKVSGRKRRKEGLVGEGSKRLESQGGKEAAASAGGQVTAETADNT